MLVRDLHHGNDQSRRTQTLDQDWMLGIDRAHTIDNRRVLSLSAHCLRYLVKVLFHTGNIVDSTRILFEQIAYS